MNASLKLYYNRTKRRNVLGITAHTLPLYIQPDSLLHYIPQRRFINTHTHTPLAMARKYTFYLLKRPAVDGAERVKNDRINTHTHTTTPRGRNLLCMLCTMCALASGAPNKWLASHRRRTELGQMFVSDRGCVCVYVQ